MIRLCPISPFSYVGQVGDWSARDRKNRRSRPLAIGYRLLLIRERHLSFVICHLSFAKRLGYRLLVIRERLTARCSST